MNFVCSECKNGDHCLDPTRCDCQHRNTKRSPYEDLTDAQVQGNIFGVPPSSRPA